MYTGYSIQAKLDVNGSLCVSENSSFKGDVTVEGKAELSDVTVSGAVKVQGPVVRKVHIATGIGPCEKTGMGVNPEIQIKSRILEFTK